MKKVKLLLPLLWLSAMMVHGSARHDSTFAETKISLQTKTGEIHGTLTVPEKSGKLTVALIIAGSGPTDRDGNNPMMKNNSLKILATHLAKNGIAAVRYDKRGIAESRSSVKSEIDLRFDDYVNDAKEWIQLLKKDKRFSKIIVIGHSEGSLIGMIAASGADKFISVAGVGQSADKTLKEQIATQPQQFVDLTFPIIDSLKKGKTVGDVNPMLQSLFRPSVQPYMISWFKYDPQAEIGKLTIPVLIVQGTNDIQVSIDDAKRLAAANPKAKLVLIDKMNHILRIVEGDRQVNISTYNNSALPLASELIVSISNFILKD